MSRTQIYAQLIAEGLHPGMQLYRSSRTAAARMRS